MGRILEWLESNFPKIFSVWLVSNLFIGIMLLVSTDFRKSVTDILVMLPVYYGLAVRTFITFIWGIGTMFFMAMANTLGYGAALAISYLLLLVVALVPLAFIVLIAEGEGGSELEKRLKSIEYQLRRLVELEEDRE